MFADVFSFFTHLFNTDDFPARWHCGDWSEPHGWLHVVSDLGVWGAYVAIPLVLLFFVVRRKNLPFRFIFVLFGAFILFCGATHLMEAVIFWWPAYRLAGLIKLSTAIVSWATVLALVPIAPRALSMKSPEELEETVRQRTAELHHEIAERKRAEQQLIEQRELLRVTLSSIGDAVIATDTQTTITFINPIAERLTGWPSAEAVGRPLDEVFTIVDERSGQRVDTPCEQVLSKGTIVGLANHTVLVGRDGRSTPIEDSAAPIRNRDGGIFGVVLVFRDASNERRHVENQERLAAIVANSQDAIISADPAGVVKSWNDGAVALFGYSAEDMIGRSIEAIVPPELKGEFSHAIESLKRGDAVEYRDTVRVRQDGTRIEVSSRLSPILNSEGELIGVSKIAHGVSQRKRSERVMRLFSEAGSVLSALVDERSMLERLARLAVPLFADWCGIVLVDSSGKIDAVAWAHKDPHGEGLLHEAARLYPVDWNTPSVVVGVLRGGQPELVSDVPETLLDAIARDERHRGLLAELSPRSMITVPLAIRGKTIGAFQLVGSSPAHRYVAEDVAVVSELARRAATAIENTRLYEDLKEAQRQKDDFLAMLAHELRNPLSAIQYANQLSQANGQAAAGTSETIDRQVKNLSHLIDDLLDVSRITRDKIRLKKEPVDGSLLVQRAAGSVQSLVAGRRHQLVVDISTEPMPLLVDPTRVEQILVNLLSNAIKYTPDGGKISLRAWPDAEQVVFSVRDSGIGIPADLLPHVFDLFTQADRSLDRSQGGLGIGLTVVRRLVELHGGQVYAASEGPGRGSEFTLRLPLAADAADAQSPPSALKRAKPQKVLVVDDNVDTAQSMAMLLRIAGHEVAVAHDGHQALEMARSFLPQTVLLDIGLPGLNGHQVARTLRADPQLAQARLVAISGYGQPEDRRRSQEAGFDEHLIKPVPFDKLLAILAE